ncbi:hypothetical protein ICC18_32625 [Paenibacillus sp. WST5]|uniref:Uncharacterized protein n=1 Tax=Paenibacillus sedimenti TaxID=2770274 RepID=A0A926QML3_9BACL|nr:hypothetical protein [Paenibacillus sedimenti]
MIGRLSAKLIMMPALMTEFMYDLSGGAAGNEVMKIGTGFASAPVH